MELDTVADVFQTDCSGRGCKNATALGHHITSILSSVLSQEQEEADTTTAVSNTVLQAPPFLGGAQRTLDDAEHLQLATTPPQSAALAKEGALPLLYLAGTKSRPELPAMLSNNAINFHRRIVYTTNPAPNVGLCVAEFVEQHPGTCVAFFSPSGVDAVLPSLHALDVPFRSVA